MGNIGRNFDKIILNDWFYLEVEDFVNENLVIFKIFGVGKLVSFKVGISIDGFLVFKILGNVILVDFNMNKDVFNEVVLSYKVNENFKIEMVNIDFMNSYLRFV